MRRKGKLKFADTHNTSLAGFEVQSGWTAPQDLILSGSFVQLSTPNCSLRSAYIVLYMLHHYSAFTVLLKGTFFTLQSAGLKATSFHGVVTCSMCLFRQCSVSQIWVRRPVPAGWSFPHRTPRSVPRCYIIGTFLNTRELQPTWQRPKVPETIISTQLVLGFLQIQPKTKVTYNSLLKTTNTLNVQHRRVAVEVVNIHINAEENLFPLK